MTKRVVLAVGCHPDDIEFGMAGTLALLAKAGFEPHMHTMSTGCCGSMTLPADEIAAIRQAEAAKSASLIKATFHGGIVEDLMVFYENSLVRKTTALIRKVKPTIVLLPSLEDYMEDHMNTARLVVTACFSRGNKNYFSYPPVDGFNDDIYLYHAQPHMNMDMMGRIIMPDLVVDIGSEMKLKEKMLGCHASQQDWLAVTQGQNSYLKTMWELGAGVVKTSGVKGIKYAEGWRQHNWVGFSENSHDLLSEVLGKRVKRAKG